MTALAPVRSARATVVSWRRAALVALCLASFPWAVGFSGGEEPTTVRADLLVFRVVPIFVAVVFICAGVVSSRRMRRPIASHMQRLLLVPVATGAVVTFLATSNRTFLAWKLVEYAVFVVVVMVVGAERPNLGRRSAASLIERLPTLVTAVALGSILVLPGASAGRAFSWFAQFESRFPPLNPDELGVIAGASILVLYTRSGGFTERQRRFGLAVSVVVLLLAQSRSAFIVLSFVLVLDVLVGRWHPKGRARITSITMVFLSASFVLIAAPVVLDFIVRGDLDQFLGGSGRDVKFRVSLDVIRESPIFGHGVGVGGRFVELDAAAREQIFDRYLGQSHSAPIEVALSAGLIGLVALSAFVGTAVARAARALARPGLRSTNGGIALLCVYYAIVGLANSFVIGLTINGIIAMSVFAICLRPTWLPARAAPNPSPSTIEPTST